MNDVEATRKTVERLHRPVEQHVNVRSAGQIEAALTHKYEKRAPAPSVHLLPRG